MRCPSVAGAAAADDEVAASLPRGMLLALANSSFVLNTARAHHNRAPSRQKGHNLKGRSGGLGAELEGSALGSIPDSIEG